MLNLRMLAAVLAAQAMVACATPSVPFTVQDASSDQYPVNDSSESAAPPPVIRLDDALFTGTTSGKTNRFYGIPFAYPPIGDRRLRKPEPLPPYEGDRSATAYGSSCPQMPMTLPSWVEGDLSKALNSVVGSMYESFTPDNEDCLTLNVVAPSGATPTSNLPVVIWIFGGGFEIGGTATYDGSSVVGRSIDLGQPVVFVSMNYRLAAYGFLAGKEVKEAGVGNLGLQDQRLAMRWVQKYIRNFGGDPSKVTIWGESAGAISVNMHMLTNGGDTEGLFRGAIMQSGGPLPVGDITHGQKEYDEIVKLTGCDRSKDTLACLRTVPYETFRRAVNLSPNFFAYQGLVLAWLPRVDGDFLKAPPQHLVLQGSVANVPFISGNCDDEGSLFSIASVNISTSADFKAYLKLFMMPTASDAQIDLLLRYYPDTPAAGCPFDTGLKNMLSPQFKRVAAVSGDFVFHGPRRFFMKQRSSKQRSWAFINKRMKDTPFIGSAHATDLINSFGNGELKDYVIRFTNNLDPNGKTGMGINWPQYDVAKPKAAVFQDSTFWPMIVTDDNYRNQALDFVANLSLIHPI
ncbi:carotenoid ester lipase precursor [Auriscalpium vulgare]|uniref:Carotenoid ester lipase n=1 Tax=Auriscalpium vulgare TaxID=40419 RepID=A0ACB8S7N5_9AGAM|nr:carotenoid ester lipase precursor [Auriscalpium vulgare]